jgi:hypothetical protein
MSEEVIVELEPGVYLAPWGGDPGRTIDTKTAKRFKTTNAANRGLRNARLYRPFCGAKIKQVVEDAIKRP